MLPSANILGLYDAWVRQWHAGPYVASNAPPLESALEALHRANFELWHEEDKARAQHAGDSAIAQAKRNIDRINQRRNDQMEVCDTLLLEELAPEHLPRPWAGLFSETPGMMLDRLSILTLKLYHTQEEIDRPNAPAGHAERNRERLAILDRQRTDLAHCLNRLWRGVLRGELRFVLYRQLKMYNDPTLNPVLYNQEK
jgi:hypothetical protein